MIQRRLAPALAALLVIGCSNTSANPPDAQIGTGGNGAGGASSSGGSRGSGGASGNASAGGQNAGGTGGNAAGGQNAGGMLGTGGVRSGGALGSGGAVNAGGAVPTGGSRTGGNVTTGGAGAGGTVSTGGTGTAGQTGTGGNASGCAVAPPAGSPVATYGQLKVVGTKIQDQSGTPVQLKGVSSFWLNWEDPKYAESKAALQYMRDNWKIKIIRIAMGIEVTGGYLSAKDATRARVDTIVQNALALGLYVIIDWHTERAVDQTSESVDFFTSVADTYGKCPNIIYEDYNEPTKVTWDQIKPYHQAVVTAIRAKDPDNLIILGTPDWSSKVDAAAASPLTGTNLLYTLHFYSCAHTATSRALADGAIAKGLPLFITEFGCTPADGGVPPNNKVCDTEAKAWWDWMAANGISGTAWKLVSGTDSSNIFSSANKPPVDGPFPDSVLSQTTGASPGHGQIVVDWLRK